MLKIWKAKTVGHLGTSVPKCPTKYNSIEVSDDVLKTYIEYTKY